MSHPRTVRECFSEIINANNRRRRSYHTIYSAGFGNWPVWIAPRPVQPGNRWKAVQDYLQLPSIVLDPEIGDWIPLAYSRIED
jgi:hypothetical protein